MISFFCFFLKDIFWSLNYLVNLHQFLISGIQVPKNDTKDINQYWFSNCILVVVQYRKCGGPSEDHTYYSILTDLARQAC